MKQDFNHSHVQIWIKNGIKELNARHETKELVEENVGNTLVHWHRQGIYGFDVVRPRSNSKSTYMGFHESKNILHSIWKNQWIKVTTNITGYFQSIYLIKG